MDAINIMRKLVAIDSGNPPGDCRKIAGLISKLLRARTRARVVRQAALDANFNVIAIFGQPRFFINCHLDTVPAASASAFDLRERNGRLYGLGATDVKGPAAAILSALINTPPRNLMLIFSGDEENGSNSGVRAFLASRYAKGLAAGIVTEPTGLNIIRYHPGVCNFEVTFKGRAAHSAYPEEGVNAIERAAGFIVKLAQYRRTLARHAFLGLSPTMNIAVIKGGVKSNIVPKLCTLRINFRNPPGLTPKKLLADLRRLITDGTTGIKETYSAPPLRPIPESSGIIRILASACAFQDLTAVNYWSEAALFRQAGIPACVFGPGDIRQAHRPDEFIRIHDLLEGEAVYRRLFEKL